MLVYINAYRIIYKRTDTEVALHRKVFQNIELKKTCVRITKSNLTKGSNKVRINRSVERITKVLLF